MLRVLILSTLFPDHARPVFGTFVERQTLSLAARGDVEVQIVVPRGLPPPPLDRHSRYVAMRALPDRETWQGLALYRPRFLHLPSIGARLDSALMQRALLPLLRNIRREFTFDIIQAEYFYPDGLAAIGIGKALGVPVSIKARGSDINYWGKRSDTRAQISRAGKQADGMLAVSAAIRGEMIALGLPADRIAVHYTGVDRALFHVRDRAQAKRALGIERPLVVTVAPLIAKKGVALVIAAMARLPGAELVILGAGPDQAALNAQVAALGLVDRVRLIGSQPRQNVANWLAAADVMALPSASEGLANAWVEALASGTPIVIADVGGAAELVNRACAGQLVAQAPEAIANAISAILLSPPDRNQVSETVAKFSWDTNSSQLFDHLTAIVARHRI